MKCTYCNVEFTPLKNIGARQKTCGAKECVRKRLLDTGRKSWQKNKEQYKLRKQVAMQIDVILKMPRNDMFIYAALHKGVLSTVLKNELKRKSLPTC